MVVYPIPLVSKRREGYSLCGGLFMIICDSVSKFILKDVDFHIPEGVAVGLIGASGSGKTTFLKLVAGLLVPDKGSIYTNRCNPVTDRKRLLENMAVLFADVNNMLF